MINNQQNRHRMVASSHYEPLTLETLPPPETCRWVPGRKAQVVAAVKAGLLTAEEACSRYALSLEEFVSWQRAFDRLEPASWQVARMRHYRELQNRKHPSDVRSSTAKPGKKKLT